MSRIGPGSIARSLASTLVKNGPDRTTRNEDLVLIVARVPDYFAQPTARTHFSWLSCSTVRSAEMSDVMNTRDSTRVALEIHDLASTRPTNDRLFPRERSWMLFKRPSNAPSHAFRFQ
jgi:hypothetical protein